MIHRPLFHSSDERNALLDSLQGSIIVSCQAYAGDPLRQPGVMRLMAQSVLNGGARGIMAQGLEDLREIRSLLGVPLIGLWKDGVKGEVYSSGSHIRPPTGIRAAASRHAPARVP